MVIHPSFHVNQSISYLVERLGPQKECRCVQMMLAVDAS